MHYGGIACIHMHTLGRGKPNFLVFICVHTNLSGPMCEIGVKEKWVLLSISHIIFTHIGYETCYRLPS